MQLRRLRFETAAMIAAHRMVMRHRPAMARDDLIGRLLDLPPSAKIEGDVAAMEDVGEIGRAAIRVEMGQAAADGDLPPRGRADRRLRLRPGVPRVVPRLFPMCFKCSSI